MNAAESNMYVHYWFYDYEKKAGAAGDLYKNYNREKFFGKEGSLQPVLKQRIDSLNTNSMTTEEFEALVDFLSEDSSGLRKSVFEGQTVNNISTATALRESKESVIGDNKIAEATAEEIATIIDDFLKKMQNAIQEMYKTIVDSGSWEDFQAAVVDEFAQTKKRPSGPIKESILKSFLTHEGLAKLNLTTTAGKESDATLQTSLRNIALILHALPDYGTEGSSTLGSRRYSTGSTKGKYKLSGSGGETLSIISGKMQGLFSNIVGKGGEIAWKVAEEKAEKEVIDFLKDKTATVTSDVIGGDLLQIEKRVSSDLPSKNKNQTTQVVSKGDVKVVIESKKITIEYGVSVKTYTFNKAGSKTVSIVDGTNFFDTAKKLFGEDNGWRYMLNLGAGHPGKSWYGREGGVESDVKSASELNTQWDALLNQIVANAFLDILMGVVTKEGPTVLYLVVNGNIIKISDILAKIADGSMDFSKRVWEVTQRQGGKTGSRALTRASLMKINEWEWKEKNKKIKTKDINSEKAIERSSKVTSALYERLKQQKINVSLNYLEALGI